jgi:hypothetical protein
MGDNAKTYVRYEIWDVHILVHWVVTLLLFLNGYYLRETSHLHDQIVAYCENRKGVLQTLSFNFYVCHPVVFVWVPKLGFCPLTGHKPGLLLALSLDIIPWGDIFTQWGCQTVHCVGGVEQRMKPLLHILCECEALASLGQAYLGSFFLEPEDIKSAHTSLGAIWNFSKVTGPT